MFKNYRAIAMAGFLAVATSGSVWAQNQDQGAVTGEPTFTVNFKDTDIQEIIKFVADVTGKTIVVDPRVKGRVKVISNRQVDKDGLMELFRSVLEVHDFMVVEVGEVVRIIPLKDARNSPVPVTEEGDTEEEGFITQVIQLKNIDAAKVLPVLRPLVPQHSHLASYPDSNAIVVSDTYANIKRLREVIEKIDTAALPTTEVIDLKYADAEELVATITKLGRAEQKGSAANQLQMVADTRNNAILLSGEDVHRERAKRLIRRLDRSQQQAGNVRVIYLDYAKAKDVATVLTKVVQNMQKTSPGGEAKNPNNGATVEADEDTNALLITGNVDVINSLMTIVEHLDIRRAQVLVEAIIVTVNAEAGKDLGVEWMFSNSEKGIVGSSINGRSNTIGGVASGIFEGENGGDDDDDTSSGIQSIATALAGNIGQALGVAGTSGDENFIALLRALKSSNDANILSTPSLLTMDNHEASISVGQQVPFQTGSFSSVQGGGGITSPFTTTRREDVGILLTVTPHVNESNKVLLDVSQEVSSLSGQDVGGQPITNQSKIETQILADDGEILVLGGLIEENATEAKQKVPLLGSIPVIGHLFQFQSNSFKKSNLMVFLRAKIMRNDEEMYGATGEKYRYMRDLQMYNREKGLSLMEDELVPVMPPITSDQLQEIEKALKEEDLRIDSGDEVNGEQ